MQILVIKPFTFGKIWQLCMILKDLDSQGFLRTVVSCLQKDKPMVDAGVLHCTILFEYYGS